MTSSVGRPDGKLAGRPGNRRRRESALERGGGRSPASGTVRGRARRDRPGAGAVVLHSRRGSDALGAPRPVVREALRRMTSGPIRLANVTRDVGRAGGGCCCRSCRSPPRPGSARPPVPGERPVRLSPVRRPAGGRRRLPNGVAAVPAPGGLPRSGGGAGAGRAEAPGAAERSRPSPPASPSCSCCTLPLGRSRPSGGGGAGCGHRAGDVGRAARAPRARRHLAGAEAESARCTLAASEFEETVDSTCGELVETVLAIVPREATTNVLRHSNAREYVITVGRRCASRWPTTAPTRLSGGKAGTACATLRRGRVVPVDRDRFGLPETQVMIIANHDSSGQIARHLHHTV